MEETVSRPRTYEGIRKTGLDMMGHVSSGTHICHFYETKEDLIHILVPYFKAGLEGNELCVWITSEPLDVQEAKAALRAAVEDLDEYVRDGQIEILDSSEWAMSFGTFEAEKALQYWAEKQNHASKRGFEGLRLSGNTFCLGETDRSEWRRYEAALDNAIENDRILAICSYGLDTCGAPEVIDAANNHHMTLVRRAGKWETVDSVPHRRVEDLRLSQERFSKAFHFSPDAIVISTLRDGRFIDVNESLLRTTGYRRAEVIGRTSKELSFWPKPEERTRFVRMLRKQGFVRDLEVKFRMKQGELRVGLLSAQVINIGKEPCSVAIMHDITERKRVEEELRRSQEELRNLSAHLQRAREQERACIAREIHDELGQALTALKMDLSWLGKRLPFDTSSLAEKVGAMSRLIDTTTKTVKRISTQLRPGLLDDLGLVAAIEWQAQEFQERTQIRCELELPTGDIALNRELATTCFRIFQEALTNVARHADATSVQVTLKKRADQLLLKVKDNGKGIAEEDIAHPDSFGLLGMRERARFCGGHVKISSVQGRGTTVVAKIPLSSKGEIR